MVSIIVPSLRDWLISQQDRQIFPVQEHAACLAGWFFGSVQNACHAHIQRGAGGARQIVDHHTFARIGLVREFLRDGEGFGHGLAIWRDRMNIHDGGEEVIQLKRGEDASGVVSVCVGEDQLAAGKRSDDVALKRVGGEKILQGQVMHEGEEVIHIHLMTGLQSAQGRAVHFEILLAQGGRVFFRDAEPLDHVQIDAVFDRLPQTC